MRLYFSTLDRAKARVRILENSFASIPGCKMAHTKLQNLFAKLSGYKSWAELKRSGIDHAAVEQKLDDNDHENFAGIFAKLFPLTNSEAQSILTETFGPIDHLPFDGPLPVCEAEPNLAAPFEIFIARQIREIRFTVADDLPEIDLALTDINGQKSQMTVPNQGPASFPAALVVNGVDFKKLGENKTFCLDTAKLGTPGC